MPGIRVGVQLASFGQPFRRAIQSASELGVDSLEIDARHDLRPSELSRTATRQIRKLLDDLNLRVVAVRFQTRRGYDCLDELDRRVKATQDAMRMASELGARVVVNQIGVVPDEAESPSLEVLRGVITDLGRYSQHYGAFLAAETGTESLATLHGFIESIPEGSMGLAMNPGNLIVNGFSLDDFPSLAKHVLLVHAKDAVRDRARGRGIEVPLGRGLAEFPSLVAALEEARYQGDYVVDRSHSPTIVPELKQAIAFLKGI